MLRESAKQLKKRKNLVIAEIGVCYGINAVQMLKHLNVKKLYLIDPYVKYKDESENGLEEYSCSESVAKRNDVLMACRDKITWIKKFSIDAAKDFKNGYFDFVYIDANHRYKYVLEDIKSWLPKVKKGGIIGGHDYNLEGVKRAVKEIFNNSHSFSDNKFSEWKELAQFTISLKNPSGNMTVKELENCSNKNNILLNKFIIAQDWWVKV